MTQNNMLIVYDSVFKQNQHSEIFKMQLHFYDIRYPE